MIKGNSCPDSPFPSARERERPERRFSKRPRNLDKFACQVSSLKTFVEGGVIYLFFLIVMEDKENEYIKRERKKMWRLISKDSWEKCNCLSKIFFFWG